jgi:SAM-dependent methyltransferase
MNFDEAARTWDGEERRVRRAKAVAERLGPILAPHRGRAALEFGCGTGLLSFFLRDSFSRIDLLDPSEGMMAVLREKIAVDDDRRRALGTGAGAEMRPVLGTLDSTAGSLGPYDAIFSMLVLHHVDDVAGALRGLRSVLAAGGLLTLVDLDSEDGSYHREYDDFNGHPGFERGALSDLAVGAGLSRPSFETIYVDRKSRDGSWKEYPMFVMAAEAEE